MYRNLALMTFLFPCVLVVSANALAEQVTPGKGTKPPEVMSVAAMEKREAPLFFRELWTNVAAPPIEHGGALVPMNVSNANLQLNLLGTAGDIDPARGPEHGIQINAGPGVPGTGHLYTGLCDRPCGMTLHDKNSYVDLSGYAKIRWSTRVSGLHQIHPLIKLADGTWLIGEHADGTADDYHINEFAPSATRWMKMDMGNLVTTGRGWLDKVDLSKVDEVGFFDPMQGGGHVNGGYVTLDLFEVYGKAVPRSGTVAPKQ